MNQTIHYNKFKDKYLNLLEQFSNYIITYKLDLIESFPKKANVVIFDDRDQEFSNYSHRILKLLLEKKVANLYSVRRTNSRVMPWEVSEPVNFIAS